MSFCHIYCVLCMYVHLHLAQAHRWRPYQTNLQATIPHAIYQYSKNQIVCSMICQEGCIQVFFYARKGCRNLPGYRHTAVSLAFTYSTLASFVFGFSWFPDITHTCN